MIKKFEEYNAESFNELKSSTYDSAMRKYIRYGGDEDSERYKKLKDAKNKAFEIERKDYHKRIINSEGQIVNLKFNESQNHLSGKYHASVYTYFDYNDRNHRINYSFGFLFTSLDYDKFRELDIIPVKLIKECTFEYDIEYDNLYFMEPSTLNYILDRRSGTILKKMMMEEFDKNKPDIIEGIDDYTIENHQYLIKKVGESIKKININKLYTNYYSREVLELN
jgi:hypothetical protein